MEIIAALGRLPDPTEFAATQAVVERFGSLKRPFAVIRRITDEDSWESIARRRREDMPVYTALARFRKRPALAQLPLTLQRDMKAFFGRLDYPSAVCGVANVSAGIGPVFGGGMSASTS